MQPPIQTMQTCDHLHNLHFPNKGFQLHSKKWSGKKLRIRQIQFDTPYFSSNFVLDVDANNLYLFIDYLGTKEDPFMLLLCPLPNDYKGALQKIHFLEVKILQILAYQYKIFDFLPKMDEKERDAYYTNSIVNLLSFNEF